eukprot:1090861-Amphidinium_carterae.1
MPYTSTASRMSAECFSARQHHWHSQPTSWHQKSMLIRLHQSRSGSHHSGTSGPGSGSGSHQIQHQQTSHQRNLLAFQTRREDCMCPTSKPVDTCRTPVQLLFLRAPVTGVAPLGVCFCPPQGPDTDIIEPSVAKGRPPW